MSREYVWESLPDGLRHRRCDKALNARWRDADLIRTARSALSRSAHTTCRCTLVRENRRLAWCCTKVSVTTKSQKYNGDTSRVVNASTHARVKNRDRTLLRGEKSEFCSCVMHPLSVRRFPQSVSSSIVKLLTALALRSRHLGTSERVERDSACVQGRERPNKVNASERQRKRPNEQGVTDCWVQCVFTLAFVQCTKQSIRYTPTDHVHLAKRVLYKITNRSVLVMSLHKPAQSWQQTTHAYTPLLHPNGRNTGAERAREQPC